MRSLLSVFLISLLSLLLSSLVCSLTPYEAADIVDITQTVQLYGFLLDTNQNDQLGRVFTEDAILDLKTPGGDVLNGLPAIIKYTSSKANESGHKVMSTTHVDLQGRGNARATVELVATHFGVQGAFPQIFATYGIYYWDVVLKHQGWRASYMYLDRLGEFGNASIIYPPKGLSS